MAEKVPGTYCPLCGEIGLVRATYRNRTWIYCPWEIPGEKEVSNPADAHTGWQIDEEIPVAVEEDEED
jgi:hypothetical protein